MADGRLDDDVSFGAHSGDPIWDTEHKHIPGFTMSGENHQPEIFSDRIVLTPAWPGNKRTAIWADHPENGEEWSADLEFRVSGPERGSGNLVLWLVKDKKEVNAASIYTVGNFDGLAVVVGQAGGKGGSVRGFLNDHSVSFKDESNVDHRTFGQCDFSYRNLGRFVPLQVRQTHDTFEISVDGRPCFKTHKVGFRCATWERWG